MPCTSNRSSWSCLNLRMWWIKVSWMLPGKKDFVSVKQRRELGNHIQKRHWATSERFISYLRKVSYSECWLLQVCWTLSKALAGASGTYAVCVCTIHQDVKLMMLGGKIVDLTVNDDIPLKSYDHCLPQVVCNPSQPACYLGTCGLCPGISGLKEHLNSLMDDCLTDSIIYREWVRMWAAHKSN